MTGDAGQPAPEYRRVFGPLRETWNRLEDEGVRITSHEGRVYDPGLSLDVQSLQPTPGLTTEVVLSTVRPTIYFGDSCIQRGEVIVGIPESE